MAKKTLKQAYVDHLHWLIDQQVEREVWKKKQEKKRIAANREKLIAGYRRHVERKGASE